jgi:hypothetical protein
VSDDIKLKFDLDASSAVSEIQKIKGTLDDLTKGKQLIEMAKDIGGLLGPLGIAAAAVYAFKKAMDFAEEGEKILKIENNFNNLAESVGLDAHKMKEELEKAAGGMMTMTDALQMSNKAIVELGMNADKIPEIMSLARMASKVMGMDTQQAFEQISMAVATGSTRMLRHIGIILDTEKVMRDYALANGVAVSEMTQFQKQQATLNAVLEQGEAKFSGAASGLNSMTASKRSASVALKEFSEAFEKFFAVVLGPKISKLVDSITPFFKTIYENNRDKSNIEKIGEDLRDINIKIYEAGEKVEYYNKKSSFWYGHERKRAAEKLEELKKEREALRVKFAEEQAMQKPKEAEKAGNLKDNKDALLEAERKKQSEARLYRETKFNLEVNQMSQKLTEDQMKYETDLGNFRMQQLQQQYLIDQEYALKEQELENEFRIKGALTEEEYEQKSELLEEQLANKRRELIERQKEQELQYYENRVKYAQTSAEGMSAAFAHGAAVAKKDLNDFGKQGQVAFQAVNNGAKKFFMGIGEGSKSASQLMREFMLGALADIAENKGQLLLASGIGTGNGVEIAEGGVLLALAGYLRSQAGGGASSGGGGGGGGSSAGVTGAPTGVDIGIQPSEQKQGKNVQINFSGSYFETDETQRRLVDLMRKETDATSYTYSQVGVR